MHFKNYIENSANFLNMIKLAIYSVSQDHSPSINFKPRYKCNAWKCCNLMGNDKAFNLSTALDCPHVDLHVCLSLVKQPNDLAKN